MSEVRLNGELIFRLCSEQQVSLVEVGKCFATSGVHSRRILEGKGAETLTLRKLRRLAERLGVEPATLLAKPPTVAGPPTPDEMKVEAVLARAGQSITRQQLAEVLSWDLRRVRRALDLLDDRLAGTAMVVHRVNASLLLLRAREEALDDDERLRTERLPLKRTGLQPAIGQMLWRIASARDGATVDTGRKRTHVQRAQLLKMQLVQEDEQGRLQLRSDVRFSLGLDT